MEPLKKFQPRHLNYWGPAHQITFTSPTEQEAGIEPCIGLVTDPQDKKDLGLQVVHVAWRLDEIELAQLANGGTLWLSTWGGLPIHNLQVQPK